MLNPQYGIACFNLFSMGGLLNLLYSHTCLQPKEMSRTCMLPSRVPCLCNDTLYFNVSFSLATCKLEFSDLGPSEQKAQQSSGRWIAGRWHLQVEFPSLQTP